VELSSFFLNEFGPLLGLLALLLEELEESVGEALLEAGRVPAELAEVCGRELDECTFASDCMACLRVDLKEEKPPLPADKIPASDTVELPAAAELTSCIPGVSTPFPRAPRQPKRPHREFGLICLKVKFSRNLPRTEFPPGGKLCRLR
jgi:hypothetical protein